MSMPHGKQAVMSTRWWAGAALALRPYTCHPTSIQTGKELVNSWHLGLGQASQVEVQIPEGSWREKRDQSRKPSWKKGDKREDVSVVQGPDGPELGLLGEVGEDEGPLLGHQLVLLYSELL